MKNRSTGGVFLGAVVAALVFLSGCAGNASIGKNQHAKMLAQGATYNDPALQAYVNLVGQRLVASSDDSNSTFTFTVIDSCR